MKTRILISIILISSNVLSQGARFPDYPSNNLLHSTNDEIQSLEIKCVPKIPSSVKRINCNLKRNSVSLKKPKETIEKELLELKTQIDVSFLELANNICNQTKTEKISDVLANMSKELCKIKSEDEAEEKVLSLFKYIGKIDSETCKISTKDSWDVEFTYKVSKESNVYWVSNSTPSGTCGIINISTLKVDLVAPSLWTYELKKIATNKDGEYMQGSSCSNFVERAVIFTWKPKTHNLNCKRVEFSGLWDYK